jgi:predicted DNA-binding transcriptional regulator AlpA
MSIAVQMVEVSPVTGSSVAWVEPAVKKTAQSAICNRFLIV